MIRGRDSFMPMDPRSPDEKMIRHWRINVMNSVAAPMGLIVRLGLILPRIKDALTPKLDTSIGNSTSL